MVMNTGESPFERAIEKASAHRWTLSGEVTRYVMVAVSTVAVFCCIALALAFYTVVDREAQHELAHECQNVARLIDESTPKNTQEVVRFLKGRVFVGSPETRLTLVDLDGTVLFDSAADEATLDNHAMRPEVIEAMETGEGESGRYSITFGEETLYYAVRLEEGSVIRLATTQSTVFGVMQGLVLPCILVIVLAFFVSLLVGRFIAQRVTSVLSDINLDNPFENEVPEELVPMLSRLGEQHKRLRVQASERRKFTSNVSHELKTPLTVISGYAEIIRNGIARPEDIPKFTGFIHTEAQHMKTMVDDLLILNRLDDVETSEVRMDMEQEVSLSGVVENVLVRLAPAAEARNIRITADTPASRGEDDLLIRGNQRMVEELVRNLAENAIRYNVDNGFVRVSVRRDEVGRPEVCVADTGEGVPMQYREKIFERFFCVDESRSKETGGTGLGLAIVKHAAQLHGATVSVRANYPRGTVFEVVFPCSAASA